MTKIFIYGEYSARKNYAEALKGCGAEPIITTDLSLASECSGLLLPGGGDIDPKEYRQENTSGKDIDNKLDMIEMSLIKSFANEGKPILGICRGLQIINTTFGGDLIQDISTSATHRWDEAIGDKTHMVSAGRDSFLYSLYGESFSVNSAHHQAIKNIAEGFTLSARASDGTIEAIENRKKGIFAVQWHPERMAFENKRKDTVDGRLIFDFFIGFCR